MIWKETALDVGMLARRVCWLGENPRFKEMQTLWQLEWGGKEQL